MWVDKVPDNAKLHLIVSKSLLSTEQEYSNIENVTLGILRCLGKFHLYCFAEEVCDITDHKPLVAILNMDVAILSKQLQHIMLHTSTGYTLSTRLAQACTLQTDCPGAPYRRQRPGNHWHEQNVNTISTAVNMPVCTLIENTQVATNEGAFLQKLKLLIT